MAAIVDNSHVESQVTDKTDVQRRNSANGVMFWSARTKSERCLMLAFTTILAVAVLLAFSLASLLVKGNENIEEVEIIGLPNAQPLIATKEDATNSIPSPLNNICLSKGCVTAAASVISRMDDLADPCESFYDFSCGRYVKETIIPDEKSSVTMFSDVQDSLREKMRLLVEENITASDPPATRMVKDLYKSCMDEESINANGLKPILTILSEMGGWPVVEGDSWDGSNFSWIEANRANRRIGFSVDYLFDLSVTTDVKNSSWRMLWVDQPGLALSREYFMKGLNDTDVQSHLDYSIKVAKLLGADDATAKKDMEDILHFQMEVANISLPREERRNMTKLYNVMRMSELQNLVPGIPWIDYISSLLPSSIEIGPSERIGVSDVNFFKNLTVILEKTPKRVIANYILWRVTAAAVSYLSDDVRDLQLEYSKKLTGKATRAPRWKECMEHVSGKLAYGVSNLYVKNFFNETSKAKAENLVSYLRQEFDAILNSIDWMDESTRAAALTKASTIIPHIGFPKELLNDDKLTEHYKNLVVDDKVLLDNMRRIGIFGTDYSFSRLREKVDKMEWKRHAAVAVVNAYYSSIENSIKFPAGILQGVFFESDRPQYMNFGAIGFVIGHEITHGFDDQGKQFDSEGNLKNWWQKSTEEKFLNKAKCIINQYGNYTAPENGMQLNGINTQGENIADNGGLKEAYKAYRKWVTDNGDEQTLPGLNYNTNQLFWISAAQVWCSKYRPESLKVRILTGVHSPGRFRVDGPFSNNEEFAKDWSCPLGTKMNPEQKCKVW